MTLGYAVAAFSFGRILVNSLFGSWLHTLGYTTTCSFLVPFCFWEPPCTHKFGEWDEPHSCLLPKPSGRGIGHVGSDSSVCRRCYGSSSSYNIHGVTVQYAGFTVAPLVGAFYFFNYCYRHQDLQETESFFHFNMFTNTKSVPDVKILMKFPVPRLFLV